MSRDRIGTAGQASHPRVHDNKFCGEDEIQIWAVQSRDSLNLCLVLCTQLSDEPLRFRCPEPTRCHTCCSDTRLPGNLHDASDTSYGSSPIANRHHQSARLAESMRCGNMFVEGQQVSKLDGSLRVGLSREPCGTTCTATERQRTYCGQVTAIRSANGAFRARAHCARYGHKPGRTRCLEDFAVLLLATGRCLTA